nr:uncharacterized protein CTRU02_09971 [Colletotrichum truncatum]KAF6787676.1 hypothetical protein CTRU02_09971 [Colletotrichum truncatum]
MDRAQEVRLLSAFGARLNKTATTKACHGLSTVIMGYTISKDNTAGDSYRNDCILKEWGQKRERHDPQQQSRMRPTQQQESLWPGIQLQADIPKTWQSSQIDTSRSTATSTVCETCGQRFGNAKKMLRHRQEVHCDLLSPQYICKCSHQTARKDNYIRHLRVSCKMKLEPGLLFLCKCQETFELYDDHLAHVKICGRILPRQRTISTRAAASTLATSLPQIPGG